MTIERKGSHRRATIPKLLLVLCGLVLPQLALADTLSYTGTFTGDDQVQLFGLTLVSQANVTFQSFGYGGGTNAAGTVVPAGGFDSLFTLFDSGGNQVASNDNGDCGVVNSYNDACLDAYVKGYLSAGAYTLALTESGNDPIFALSDGFSEQGQGNFTANGACSAFCDVFGNQDNGSYAVDITVDTIPSSPEPITFALTFSGLTLLALARRRRAHIRTS